MDLEYVITTIVGVVIAYVVPRVLKEAEKEIAPSGVQVKWFQWCLGNAIGTALGATIGVLVTIGIGPLSFGGMVNWAVFGASVGILQWFAVRRYLGVGSGWAVASAAGWAMFALYDALSGKSVFSPESWIVAGLSVGILQWLSLRLSGTRSSGWWVIANPVAWLVGALIGALYVYPLAVPAGPIVSWIACWGMVGVVGGIILTIPLVRMPMKRQNSG